MKKNKFFSNWHIKLVCFFLALATIYFIYSSMNNKRTIELPLNIIMPENYKAVSTIPESVKLVIQGSEELIYMVDVEKIKLFADFSSVLHEGVSSAAIEIDFSLSGEIINFSNLSMYTEPSSVRIYFEKI